MAVAALLVGAPAAHADTSDYLAALHANGVVGENTATEQALIMLGYTVCNAFNKGESPDEIAQTIEGGSVTEDNDHTALSS